MVTKKELPEGKLALFWVAGSVLVLAGAWIAGHLEWTVCIILWHTYTCADSNHDWQPCMDCGRDSGCAS